MSDSKRCSKCEQTKPISEYHKRPERPCGYRADCIECERARAKLYNRSPAGFTRHRKRYENSPYRGAESAKRWKEQNPEAVKAHNALNHAIRDGKMERLPCAICGKQPSEAHHEDYSKPFIVIWLCRVHHRRYHADGQF